MDRNELHSLVLLLKDGIAAGRIVIRDQALLTSLARVRFAADGIVDSSSVSSDVRAAAIGFAGLETRREMKEIPLHEVQSAYFEILDKFFGKPFSEMKANKVSPAQIAAHMASQDKMVQAFANELEEFASGMLEFWTYYAPIVELHLEDLKCLKSVFGGDVFPSYQANIACSVGLYMDTVVLPDPLLRILNLARVMEPRESFRLITKHSLTALAYKDLALAEVDPPIVVLVADPMFLEPPYLNLLQGRSDADVVKHASRMFGHRFRTTEELYAFLSKFATADEMIGRLEDPKRFLFDTEWSEPLSKQFVKYVKDTASKVGGAVGESVAETTYKAFVGRMMQTNDLLFRAARYSGTPLIDAPTSWQYLLWKYEYDSESAGTINKDMQNTVISKAIESEGSTEFGMLSGVPVEALIELRRNGALAGLRETIRRGLNDLDLASADSLKKVADEVVSNIDRAFEEHSKELNAITSSRRKFFGLDVGRWIANCGLSVATALSTHNAGLAALAAVGPALVGMPSIPDLHKRWQELQSRSQQIQRSPTAILFRHLGTKFGFSS